MNSTNEINEYLKRLKSGEPCLEQFFYAASGHIKFIAYKYLIDKSFLNDVVMNTFCKIIDNIEGFDENQNGKAWISKIAQNEAYTINNRERKHDHVSLDEISEEIACTSDDSVRVELTADLYKALDKLDERDREIFELRVFEDRTFEYIARKLDMYVGTVYKRYTKSIKIINKDIL